jgi:Zn-dependent peptidase ImmA (M78 family)
MADGSAPSSRHLKRDLRQAGLSNSVIQAAWPSWWSQDAEGSPSAQAELRFALARKLGLSAPALMGDRVDFVWKDEARFKRRLDENEIGHSVLASFAVAVGHLLLQAHPSGEERLIPAAAMRSLILRSNEVVDLQNLLTACWSVGIPVLHLRIFPLEGHKGMHSMAVRSQERFAILLARDAQYPAPVAFDLAHELGHIMLGHLANATAVIDEGDPATAKTAGPADEEEDQAHRYALELLTGQPEPDIRTNFARFNGRQLSRAVLAAWRARRIEPGTLALCAAFQTEQWGAAMAALKDIYEAPKPVWREVNVLAAKELEWSLLGADAAEFLQGVMGLPGGA